MDFLQNLWCFYGAFWSPLSWSFNMMARKWWHLFIVDWTICTTQIQYPSHLSRTWSVWVKSYKFPLLLHQVHLLDRAMEKQWQWKCMLGRWAFSGGNKTDGSKGMLAEDDQTFPQGVGCCTSYCHFLPTYPMMHSTYSQFFMHFREQKNSEKENGMINNSTVCDFHSYLR